MAVRDEPAVRDRRRAFEEAWPVVEARLRRVLAARRVPAADHDDFLQEVAARVLAAEHLEFESADELMPWAATVLRRLHVDAHRRADRAGARLGLDPERGNVADVAVEVEARMELDAVAKVMATWSPASREVLLSVVDSGVRRPNAFYVRRHRLRLKLLAAVEGLGGLWGNVWRRIDPTALFDRLRAVEAAQPAATALLAPVAACAVALLLGGFSPGNGNGDSAGAGAGGEAHRDGPGSVAPVAAVLDGAGTVAANGANESGAEGGRDNDNGRHPPASSGHAPPRKDSVVPPVEERRVEGPEAAGYEPTIGVENREGPQPLWCYWDKPVLGDGCVGEAIYVPI